MFHGGIVVTLEIAGVEGPEQGLRIPAEKEISNDENDPADSGANGDSAASAGTPFVFNVLAFALALPEHRASAWPGSEAITRRPTLRALFEFQRDAVQAITQPRRRRTIIEDVAEMRPATRAKNFVAFHSEAEVFHGGDDRRD